MITITLIEKFKKVTFYSILLEGKSVSPFENFTKRHSIHNKEKLNHILAWISIIGNKRGARNHFFRNEANIADTRALPPKGKDIEPTYVEFDTDTGKSIVKPNDLRLYCFGANESVVFLFDGDIKTALTAQECINVKPYFDKANTYTKVLEKAFQEGLISWNNDYTDIHFTNPIDIKI